MKKLAVRSQSGVTTGLRSERKKKTSSRPAEKRELEDEDEQSENEQESISRKELLEKALRVIANDLNAQEKRPTNTITNLVQLLKLDRAFREDEEEPHEIRVVWQEKRNETHNDSAESSSDGSHEA